MLAHSSGTRWEQCLHYLHEGRKDALKQPTEVHEGSGRFVPVFLFDEDVEVWGMHSAPDL